MYLGRHKELYHEFESDVSHSKFDNVAQLCLILGHLGRRVLRLPNRVEAPAFEERQTLTKYERKSVDKLIDATIEGSEPAF